ncbi:eukaryotic initiation factor 4A-III [Histomonas meleagridis]|uniref:eukaryotic initiation factor 4A-III n=1 Tax=Histomonas meleagridis TaxID=135588 RepID=UPI003559676E|nr:eukaryotic initiation factor 4A-III [Histomonas meleagridis]KAH0800370.1 eukaryotic initiation factor 4A-III [Histomonas meleagridis]
MSYQKKNNRRFRRREQPAEENPNFTANWDQRIDDFEQMGLNQQLVHGIYSYGFKHPSDIQSLAIQPIIEKRQVIAQAQSGTGKTGAFGIGILNNLDLSLQKTQALVLSPTRELATQTFTFMKEIGIKMNGLTIELFTGGHSESEDQDKASSLPMVAVGTPGRVLSLIESGHLRCEDLVMVCLDEADEMLSQGFIEQIQEIFRYLNPTIQILLFSATVPPEVFNIAEKFMVDPIKILVKAEKLTLEGIRQFYVNVGKENRKMETLADLFGRFRIQKAVIFANTKDVVDYIKEQMERENFMVSAIHSGLPQSERDRIMQQFRVGATRVLIGTDLIARGIDVQQVTLVMNFEMPIDRESYLHRIGRSGRYGRKGIAINICCGREMRIIADLEKFYNTNIEELPSTISDIVQEANEQFE